MSSKKSHDNVTLKNIIARISEVSGYNNKQIASKIFDISSSNFANKLSRETLDFFKIIQWATHDNVNLNWLFTGEGAPYDSSETKVAEDPEISELIRITREIISQDTTYSQTLKANIRLAHEASERFRNLDGRVCALEELSADPKWLERRKAERRTQNDPDAIPGDVDRRSGTDRRRVAANK